MKLNCDLGEGLDEVDAALMPHIDMASIACGGHTGDANSMRRAIDLAQQHSVSIGAHPSYPDRENFGRRSIQISPSVLHESLCEQIQNLIDIAQQSQAHVDYIKPHGALYNDAWHHDAIQNTLTSVAEQFNLKLVLQARPQNQNECRHEIMLEAFADRAYTDLGTLVSRDKPHATHAELDSVIAQGRNLKFKKGLYSENGVWLHIDAQTLCVHSDSPNAVSAIEALKAALDDKPTN
ncbi:MAG: 5-oxoprolinase subunit PxpA [Agarilytica sp.]